MVGDISDIKREYRDHFLIRYIARCKLANALAFFQWRCMTLEDPAEVERNKVMFDLRVRALINNITSSIEKKKTLFTEKQATDKSKKRQATLAAKDRKQTLRTLETTELLQMQQ